MVQKSLEVTIPVLNEESRLRKGVSRTVEFLRANSLSFISLVIADNGSTDRTGLVAAELVSEYPGLVRYIKVPRRGVGLALQTAWAQSSADVVGYMDVDLSTDIRHILQVVQAFQRPETAVVVGSRLLSGSEVENRTFVREFISRTFNLILAWTLGVRFSDGMCGFKFLKRAVALDLIGAETTTEGWFFCTELLVKAEWRRTGILELPVHWSDDVDSRVKVFQVSSNYLKEIQRLRKTKRYWCGKYAD